MLHFNAFIYVPALLCAACTGMMMTATPDDGTLTNKKMMTHELKKELIAPGNAPVAVLFGGNPVRRDEVVELLGSKGDITVYGTLSEEEGMAKIEELNRKVDVVLIGGRYSPEQRIRISQWVKDRMPGAYITQPGYDYPYSNEAILNDVRQHLAAPTIKIIKATERRVDENGWKKSWHEYYPGRTNWGLLTGFNFDIVQPGKGFGMHPHNDMEIVTIPVQGTQLHADSLGNRKELSAGEVQVMSAGTGIMHSEVNASATEVFASYQIWIYPGERGLRPSYVQKQFPEEANGSRLLISPTGEAGSLSIHARAWFTRTVSTEAAGYEYKAYEKVSKIYLHVVEGTAELYGKKLEKHDSAEIGATDLLKMNLGSNTSVLLIETKE